MPSMTRRSSKAIACSAIAFLPVISGCGRAVDSGLVGFVFEDANANGKRDTGERPIPNVVVQIVSSTSGELRSLLETDSEGKIDEFLPGSSGCAAYRMHLSVPKGYWPTTAVVNSADENCYFEFGIRPYLP